MKKKSPPENPRRFKVLSGGGSDHKDAESGSGSHKIGRIRSGSRLKSSVAHLFGLSGGIAAGKSTVATLFREAGVATIDADDIARKLSQKGGRAFEAIFTRFKTHDRQAISQIIFNDPKAKKDLEAILHPLIRLETQDQVQKIVEEAGQTMVHIPILYEAALLIETGYYKQLQGLIIVVADEALRLQRLIENRQISADAARKMILSQADDQERRALADCIIHNNGSLEDLRQQVNKILPYLQKGELPPKK